jgi:arylsulfatase A-like enzyme
VCLAFITLFLGLARCGTAVAAGTELPNIVIILIDDLGYADIGALGAKGYSTPHLDRMAREGRVFTDFHSATAVCSASRAALLTGCYPERVSILGALGPTATHGIHADELTLAELCKCRGYATAIFGKWHLGHRSPFLPLQHGFDEYFGLPYSNDMWPFHPDYVDLPPDAEKRKRGFPDLPVFEGNNIIDPQVSGDDQTQLTTWYTERAVEFIRCNKERPFFLYVPHSMVHVPLFVSERFRGASNRGLFGDVMMEIDWSVGEILGSLREHNLDHKTLVIFTSDNGPWLSYGDHAGSAGPLREGKGTLFEGGFRVPCVMRWLGRIPPGTRCDELATSMDLLPTVANLLNVPLGADRVIDGRDIWPLVSGAPGAASPHEVVYCYYDGQLHAVRDRRWKLFFPHEYRTLAGRPGGTGGKPVAYDQQTIGHELFDLKNDVGETTNVADLHPEIVSRLEAAAEHARTALGDSLASRTGSEIRPAGQWTE